MRFRLTYEGELRPTQRDPQANQHDKLAVHKQRIRRDFHRQLRHLWTTNRFLREAQAYPDGSPALPLRDHLAAKYEKFGYRFVPLVRDEDELLCSLSILFLRRDIPGKVVEGGDIDNRIKTIIDALRAPKSPNELIDADAVPSEDDAPFYCLLWDDSQVSHIDVEADVLLDPLTGGDADLRRARLIITVEIKPYIVTVDNASYG